MQEVQHDGRIRILCLRLPQHTRTGQTCSGGISGIQKGDYCCKAACGICGGVGCADRGSGLTQAGRMSSGAFIGQILIFFGIDQHLLFTCLSASDKGGETEIKIGFEMHLVRDQQRGPFRILDR